MYCASIVNYNMALILHCAWQCNTRTGWRTLDVRTTGRTYFKVDVFKECIFKFLEIIFGVIIIVSTIENSILFVGIDMRL